MNKKQVRIYYTGFWPGFHQRDNLFHTLLQERYDIVIDKKNPDYVIFGCFDDTHLRYDAIKIFFSGENICADFNYIDYAVSSEYLEFGDRYFRLPYWRWELQKIPEHPRRFYENLARTRQKFCNFIYSNSNAEPERNAFFKLLSQRYKQVDSGGRHLNNIGGTVKDKVAWQRDYKFSIAFENSSQPGYSTEKIIDALKADTIPIYWGDPCLAQEINPKRFINVHDFDSFDAVIEEVKRLDQDDQAYIDMLAQPWFVGDPPPPILQDEIFKKWFFHIFDQDKEKARRVTRFGLSEYYLQKRRKMIPRLGLAYFVKNFRPIIKTQIKIFIRPLIRKIESPFKKLRTLFYRDT